MTTEKLRKAYQRIHAREVAVFALLHSSKRRIFVRRMMEKDIWPAVSWAKDPKGVAHLLEDISVSHPWQVVRYIGEVVPESYGGRGCFSTYRGNGDHRIGWHTRPDGDVCRDGDGLCWGVVCQLAGKNGLPRFVAGYQFGGCDGGPTIDFSRIFEDEQDRGQGADGTLQGLSAAREAARYADDMARNAAEEERIYQEEQQEERDKENEDEEEAA